MHDGFDNIHGVIDQADQVDMNEGLLAYSRYNVQMKAFARHYSIPLPAVVGAFVYLSPNNSYWSNLRSLASVLTGVNAGLPAERVTVSTYNHLRDCAYKMATGEQAFLDCAKGPKIRSFYQNILDPLDRTPVTVDGHMISVWCGRRYTMKEAVNAKPKYDEIAHDFRRVAFMRGLIPNQAQAICWFVWKRINGIIAPLQLDLYAGDDQWRTVRDVERIKPFKRRE